MHQLTSWFQTRGWPYIRSYGNITEATRINDLIFPLNDALFIETSPGPVKYALSLMKKCKNQLRLPLVTINEKNEKKIKDVMNKLHLI